MNIYMTIRFFSSLTSVYLIMSLSLYWSTMINIHWHKTASSIFFLFCYQVCYRNFRCLSLVVFMSTFKSKWTKKKVFVLFCFIEKKNNSCEIIFGGFFFFFFSLHISSSWQNRIEYNRNGWPKQSKNKQTGRIEYIVF